MKQTPTSARPHRVILQNPGPPILDDEGGSTRTYVDLQPPAISVEIKAATAAALERVTSGTVLSIATHIISGPFHPQATTETRVLFNGRIFGVSGVTNVEERGIEMVLVCTETVP